MNDPPSETEAETLERIDDEDIGARAQIYGYAGCFAFIIGYVLLAILLHALHIRLPFDLNWLWGVGCIVIVAAFRYHIPLYLFWKAGRWQLSDGTKLYGARARIVIYWLGVIIAAMLLPMILAEVFK